MTDAGAPPDELKGTDRKPKKAMEIEEEEEEIQEEEAGGDLERIEERERLESKTANYEKALRKAFLSGTLKEEVEKWKTDDELKEFLQERVPLHRSAVTDVVGRVVEKMGSSKTANDIWQSLIDNLQTDAINSIDIARKALYQPFEGSFDNQVYKLANDIGVIDPAILPIVSLIDERIMVAAIARYHLMEKRDQQANTVLYNALKQHLKTHHQGTFKAIQRLLETTQKSWIEQLVEKAPSVRSIIAKLQSIFAVTRGKDPRGLAEQGTGMAAVEISSRFGKLGSFFLVSVTAIVLSMVAISELLAKPRSKDVRGIVETRKKLNDTLTFMVDDLDKMVKKSSYRFTTVIDIFTRIFEAVGASGTTALVSQLANLPELSTVADIESNLATVAVVAAMRETEGETFVDETARKNEIQVRANKILDQLNAVLRRGDREETTRFLKELMAPYEERRARISAQSGFSRLAGIVKRRANE